MGKCLRSCRQRLSPAAVEAAAYLTLRSGRRCGYNAASARKGAAGGSASAAAAAARLRRRRRVVNSLGAGREVEEELTPSSQENSPVVCNESCGDRWKTPHSGEAKHGHENNGVAAGRPLSSPPEAEIEKFFAAAELALHRRFAETYNYDVALDRPLEGRYEWAPVIEHARGVKLSIHKS